MNKKQQNVNFRDTIYVRPKYDHGADLVRPKSV